jgi:hypothetical protein
MLETATKIVTREKLIEAFAPFAGHGADQDHRIKMIITLLMPIGGPGRETALPAFRRISPQSANREAKQLAHHAGKAAALLKAMSGTLIGTLDEGGALDMEFLRGRLPAVLGPVAMAAKAAADGPKINAESSSGALPKGRVIVVGDMLARFYAATGARPTKTVGSPFFNLVAAVIDALDVAPGTARELIRKGQLQSVKVGPHRVVLLEEAERFFTAAIAGSTK